MMTKQVEEARGFGAYVKLRHLVIAKPVAVLRNGSRLARVADRPVLPRLTSVVGSAYRRIFELDYAAQCFLYVEDSALQTGDDWALADNYQRLGHIYFDCGSPEQSLHLAERATGIFERIRDRAGIGRSIFDQALWLSHLREHERAREAYYAALEILPLSEKAHRTTALINLGTLAEEMGEYDLAEELSTQALDLTDISGITKAWAYDSLGRIAFRRREWDLATELFETAYSIYEEGHFYFEQAIITIVVCRSLLRTGRADEVNGYVEKARALLRCVKNRHVSAILEELVSVQIRGEEVTAHLLSELYAKARKLIEINLKGHRTRRPLPIVLRTRPRSR